MMVPLAFFGLGIGELLVVALIIVVPILIIAAGVRLGSRRRGPPI